MIIPLFILFQADLYEANKSNYTTTDGWVRYGSSTVVDVNFAEVAGSNPESLQS